MKDYKLISWKRRHGRCQYDFNKKTNPKSPTSRDFDQLFQDKNLKKEYLESQRTAHADWLYETRYIRSPHQEEPEQLSDEWCDMAMVRKDIYVDKDENVFLIEQRGDGDYNILNPFGMSDIGPNKEIVKFEPFSPYGFVSREKVYAFRKSRIINTYNQTKIILKNNENEFIKEAAVIFKRNLLLALDKGEQWANNYIGNRVFPAMKPIIPEESLDGDLARSNIKVSEAKAALMRGESDLSEEEIAKRLLALEKAEKHA